MKILYTELLSYKQHVYFCAWLVSLFCFGFFFTVQWLSSPSTLPCLLSTPSVVYPTRPALFCCGQIREPKITADYPAHRIATQLQAAEHRAGFSLWKCAQHRPFKKNPEGLAAITHLANATGKGFILWATLDRIISIYSAKQQALHFVKGQPLPALLIY